ncbi:MAG: beta-ketoacyl synthase N-terminal-like domain-containing protein, partial [Desulfosarcinaceae bacterium]
AGWHPHDIDLIECHGTGTPAGDAVEAASLRELWGTDGWRPEQCAIGSVKSMIGHLLTGAGAAGMIKVLSALKHKTLPPSQNFSRLKPDSPLIDGPFRVQTESAPWKPRDPDNSRKAAVSAFGFGGINAHVLVEEYLPAAAKQAPSPITIQETPSPAIAIVGMATAFGELGDLRQFQHAVFGGRPAIKERPADRWKRADGAVNTHLKGKGRFGAYLSDVRITAGQFQVPPNEIPDILPQQLLMLKIGADALTDAGLSLRAPRPRMGATIGVNFDMEATNFHLRWQLPRQVREWNRTYRLELSEEQCDQWAEALADEIGPPLTATRTLGALGGIVASRVAREFKFGGPSFIVSQEEASGLRALEIAVRALQQDEVDALLVGAVDLCGDPRAVISLSHLSKLSAGSSIRAFDRNADGTLIGEGAAAVVLKRLEDAVADGDRIYAVVRGVGSAMGEALGDQAPEVDIYTASVRQCLGEAKLQPEQVDLFEAHGSGVPAEDAAEAEALRTLLPLSRKPAHALGTVKPVIGHTGASAGLASVVKAALCLQHRILAPLPHLSEAADVRLSDHGIHLPAFSSHWLKDKAEGPLRACVGAITRDGGCMHLLLEETGQEKGVGSSMPHLADRLRPLGDKASGLFLLPAGNSDALRQALEALTSLLNTDHPLETSARQWYRRHPLQATEPKIAVAAKSLDHLRHLLEDVKAIGTEPTESLIDGPGGIAATPKPLGEKGEIAFVFPGSGNHYLGMGRGIGLQWPHILREVGNATDRLCTQMLPEYYLPWRADWRPGWEGDARRQIEADVLRMIFGQVVHGGLMARVMDHFGVRADVAIGYSLGESAAHFAMGVWPERGEMLARMQGLDLFTTRLAGPCLAARRQWGIGKDEAFDWTVAVVPQPKTSVEAAIDRFPRVRLLIVNTPDECVIGGHRPQVEAAIKVLGGEAHFLQGVVTVHCDAALPAAEAYRDLHRFPVTAPEGYRYYSCAEEKALNLTSDALADAITRQATRGFDFTLPVARAHADGVRIFVEMGPGGSCSRMIRQILGDKPHLALSACQRGEDDYFTLLKLFGNLAVHGVAVNLDRLYGPEAYPPDVRLAPVDSAAPVIRVPVGGHPIQPKTPPPAPVTTEANCETACTETWTVGEPAASLPAAGSQPTAGSQPSPDQTAPDLWQATIDQVVDISAATARAHEQFLQLSQELTATYAQGVALQQQLGETNAQAYPPD